MDVIREFVLRGRMEIVKSDLQVPDISAFTKVTEESNRLQQELFNRVNAVSQALEEGARQAKERQSAEEKARAEAAAAAAEAKTQAEEAAKRAAEQKAAIEAVEKARQEAAETAREIAEAEKRATEQAAAATAKAEKDKQDAIDATNKALAEQLRRETEINDHLLKSGDALKTTADGAFALARGLTLIGFEGSDSLEEVARAVANVQGKFDIFRGSVDLLKGGVETTRSLGKALELAGGPVTLLTTRFSALTTFLGPAGLIATGLVATGAAIITVFSALEEETESYTDRAEKNLQDYISRTERMRAQAQNAWERDDAIRSRMTAEEQVRSSREELGAMDPARTFSVAAEQQERKGIAQRLAEIEKTRRAILNNPDGVLTDSMVRELEGLDAEAGGLTTRQGVLDPKKREAEIALEIKNAERREGLRSGILAGTTASGEAADRERTVGIREAEQQLEQRRNEMKSASEKLEQEQAKRQEEERKAAAERGRLSVPDRAFFDRISGNISDPNTTKAQLERLAKLSPTGFGQKVEDEFTRRESGVAVARPDSVAQAQATVKALEQAAKDAAEQLRKKQEEDKKLDAATAEERAANIALANAATKAVTALKNELDAVTRELNQGG